MASLFSISGFAWTVTVKNERQISYVSSTIRPLGSFHSYSPVVLLAVCLFNSGVVPDLNYDAGVKILHNTSLDVVLYES